MFSTIPCYEGHIYVEGKGYDLSTPIPIIGWQTEVDGIALPILAEATPEYKARLAQIDANRVRTPYEKAMDNWSAEDFDHKCDEVHQANQVWFV